LDEKADEYATLVRDGSLSAEEAAKCLAGADLKERAAIEEDTGKRPGQVETSRLHSKPLIVAYRDTAVW